MAAVFISCTETPVLKSDIENDNLRGQVKSVISMDFKAIDKFSEGIIEKGDPQSFGTEIIEYDTLGFYKEIKRYYLEKIDKWGTYIYENNKNQRRYEHREDGYIISSGNVETLDDKGTVIEEKDLSSGKTYKYQAKYDNEGNLIYYKDRYTVNNYKYANGKVIQKSVYENVFERTVVYEYEYDVNGNMIKEIRSSKEWKDKVYFFTKYDQFNRKIDSYNSKVENPSNDDIIYRFKYYYENDSSKRYNLSKSWFENTEEPTETRYIWFTNSNDTTCQLEFNEKLEIKHIDNILKGKDRVIKRKYGVKGVISNHTKYHYKNAQLASKTNNDGYKALYKYNNNGELYEVEEINGVTKYITTYVNHKPKSRIKYGDEDTRLEYDYKKDGDTDILLVTCYENGTQKYTEQTFFKNGRKIKYIDADSEIFEYFYNDNGELQNTKSSNGDEVKYTYEYDKKGNWIKQINFRNGLPDEITERAITYY